MAVVEYLRGFVEFAPDAVSAVFAYHAVMIGFCELLDRVPEADGFYGASSMERLPTEVALTEQIRKFVAIRRG